MTDVWISTKKHYCQTCNCWLSGHPRNVAAHEQTECHKVNQQKQIQRIYSQEREKRRRELEVKKELERINKEVFTEYGDPFKERATPKPVKALKASDPNAKFLPTISNSYRGPGVYSAPPTKNPVLPPSNIPPPRPPPTTFWMSTIDPETMKPVYFNTITKEIRYEDPSENNFTIDYWNMAPKESNMDEMKKQQEYLSQILPKMEAVAESYRQHVLKDKVFKDDSLPNVTTTPKTCQTPCKSISAPCKITKEAIITQGVHCLAQSLQQSVPKRNVVNSLVQIDLTKHHLAVKTSDNVLDPATAAISKLAPSENPAKPSSALSSEEANHSTDAVSTLFCPTAQVLPNVNLNAATGMGEWQEVEYETNHFGQPADDDSDDEETPISDEPKQVTNEKSDYKSSSVWVLMKEDAEKGDLLNQDDLERTVSADIINPNCTSCSNTTGAVFKRRTRQISTR